MPWDPGQYERFREERLQPGRDRIDLVEPGRGLRVVDLGAERIRVHETVYPHVLENAAAIVEWQKGTALLPLLETLDEQDGEAFLDAFRARLADRYPGSPVLFPFRRTFCSACAPA